MTGFLVAGRLLGRSLYLVYSYSCSVPARRWGIGVQQAKRTLRLGWRGAYAPCSTSRGAESQRLGGVGGERSLQLNGGGRGWSGRLLN